MQMSMRQQPHGSGGGVTLLSSRKRRYRSGMTVKKQPKGIQAIGIGFGLLDHLASAQKPMSLGVLASIAGMAPSKARFYLVSFVRLGLVNQDPVSGLYTLGPGAIRLGLSALEQFDVVVASKAVVHRLADQLGFSTYLAVWGTHGPTVVYRADGKSWTSLDVRVGTVLPLLSSATGRAFLPYLPKSITRTLAEREIKESKMHGGRQFRPEEIIRTTRKNALAIARTTLFAEITAIASPILDYAGLPAAVISIAGRVGALDDSVTGKPASLLRQATTELSRQLGFHGD